MILKRIRLIHLIWSCALLQESNIGFLLLSIPTAPFNINVFSCLTERCKVHPQMTTIVSECRSSFSVLDVQEEDFDEYWIPINKSGKTSWIRFIAVWKFLDLLKKQNVLFNSRWLWNFWTYILNHVIARGISLYSWFFPLQEPSAIIAVSKYKSWSQLKVNVCAQITAIRSIT